jgi:excisionase family DNA binding protein
VSELTLQVVLDDTAIDRLAAGIASRLPSTSDTAAAADGWLSSRQAAEYLGITLAALHRLTASRRIPFSQDRPGARCWFRRGDLDAWRQEGAQGPQTPR